MRGLERNDGRKGRRGEERKMGREEESIGMRIGKKRKEE